MYFGKDIPEKKLELARKDYADYAPTKERPLLLIETKMFGIWTDVVIFLTNKNMYFDGYADIDSKGWYDAPVPEGKGLIPLNYLKNGLNRGEYSLEFDDSCLKIVGYILVPVVCYVGYDTVRFLKGLFTLLMASDVLQKE